MSSTTITARTYNRKGKEVGLSQHMPHGSVRKGRDSQKRPTEAMAVEGPHGDLDLVVTTGKGDRQQTEVHSSTDALRGISTTVILRGRRGHRTEVTMTSESSE